SGFHVGLVAGFFSLLCAGAWRLFPRLGRLLPRPQASAAAALIGAVGYAAVAGFALPTVRTVLMIAVVVLARASRRPLGAADSLARALLAVLAFDPLALLAPGFWLSFAGVAWLVWCLPQASGPLWRQFLSAQGAVTLGLLPLTVVLFGQASLAGPFANLVAIPWWSLVVVPLSLVGTALEAAAEGWGGWAWRAAAWCFDLTWPGFSALAESRFALRWLPEAQWFAVPLALLGAFWLLLPRAVPGKALAALLWLPLLWPDRRLPAQGEVELMVVDVGSRVCRPTGTA
ncbi:MAG TPA: ComEC/Rec2 family competence protein, partial [Rubrivivax sp.]|nr:ComEC/Rec2 family competence protein [Rubrivivax sp.]